MRLTCMALVLGGAVLVMVGVRSGVFTDKVFVYGLFPKGGRCVNAIYVAIVVLVEGENRDGRGQSWEKARICRARTRTFGLGVDHSSGANYNLI